jgi:hypothetical protein
MRSVTWRQAARCRRSVGGAPRARSGSQSLMPLAWRWSRMASAAVLHSRRSLLLPRAVAFGFTDIAYEDNRGTFTVQIYG